MNSEQFEIFINALCSIVQPMLFQVGGINISNDFASSVVNLVITLFQQFKRVFVGGLFIIHGLTAAIEGRIEQYVETLLTYIASALDVS